MGRSLYIHIPFCRRRCVYCDFYSNIYRYDIAASYIDILSGQIKGLSGDFQTIYIGGGTPSVLDKDLLRKLLDSLKDVSSAASEFTIEANPESLDDEKMKLFLGAGVTRLSVGVQSFDEKKLKRLGRMHTAARAKEAVRLAARKGFKNISIDMIFGIWDEAPDEWKRDIDTAVNLPVTHISCYCLTYEKGTPLFSALENKSLAPLDDCIAAAMYEEAIDALSLRGFKQYEVSNFAKPGYECSHNLRYWDNDPYIGLGPSAVSYEDGVRSKNVSCVEEYVNRAGEKKSMVESSEKLSPVKRAKETAAIKIRTREGIDFAWFKDKTGFGLQELEKRAITELLEKDLIKYKKEANVPCGIALKRKGFLFCDTVSSALL